MAEVVPWPVIARRIPDGASLASEPARDDAHVVELRRIRELVAFAKACREQFGNSQ